MMDFHWVSLPLYSCTHIHTFHYISRLSEASGVGGTVSQLSLWSCRSASEPRMSLTIYSVCTQVFSFFFCGNLMQLMLMKNTILKKQYLYQRGSCYIQKLASHYADPGNTHRQLQNVFRQCWLKVKIYIVALSIFWGSEIQEIQSFVLHRILFFWHWLYRVCKKKIGLNSWRPRGLLCVSTHPLLFCLVNV